MAKKKKSHLGSGEDSPVDTETHDDSVWNARSTRDLSVETGGARRLKPQD